MSAIFWHSSEPRYCVVLGLAEWSSFSLSILTVLLCTISRKGAENTPVLWVQLSSTGAASALALSIASSRGWVWARSWKGTQPDQMTQINQRGIYSKPYDANSDTKSMGGRKNGVHFLFYNVFLPDRPLHVLKPCSLGSGWASFTDGKYLVIQTFTFYFFLNFFVPRKLPCLNLQVVLHLIFSLLPHWERKW